MTGGYQAEFLQLTNRGLRIFDAPGTRDRLNAKFEALLDNEIFEAYLDRFNDRPVPNTQVAVDYLIREQSLSSGRLYLLECF